MVEDNLVFAFGTKQSVMQYASATSTVPLTEHEEETLLNILHTALEGKEVSGDEKYENEQRILRIGTKFLKMMESANVLG